MENNVGDPELLNKLNSTIEELHTAVKFMKNYGKEFAQKQREYKIALKQEVLRLKDKDTPATVINLIVYGSGEVPDKRLERDISQVMYDTAQEHINVLKLEARLLEAQIDREYKG